MAKKFIDIMDTSFRDGFQSVFGGRVLMEDFFPALEAAKAAGLNHFEFGGGARFQSLFFYLNENAFDMMDKFRSIVGPSANLQTLSRGISTVMLDTGSSELIDLHAKLFKKHGTTTIRNFDALNDIRNLEYSGECIKKYGIKHEAVVTIMDLPPGCTGAHDVKFYETKLREIIKTVDYDSICFKDASGTASPDKIYRIIKMAKNILPQNVHVRLHTHETAGISVASYLAALEAGVDGIDLAAAPVSGGTSQPDILTLLHAVKGKDFDLGGLEIDKILTYEQTFKECLSEYFLPPEAVQVLPIIPLSPMPGGALTANTQMMRDNNTLDKFTDVILGMREVVEKGGYGTSVTPVSQFYWQQAYANVMFGKWKQIAPGYGKMVLGYFGKTPIEPDKEIVELAREKLSLEPTKENPLDIANADATKSLSHWKEVLVKEGIPFSEENLFIAASCDQKGIQFLKGEAPVNIRKKDEQTNNSNKEITMSGEYTVLVNGETFNVQVSEGTQAHIHPVETKMPKGTKAEDILANVPGVVSKILVKVGDHIEEGENLLILESMKMEIEVAGSKSGVVESIFVSVNDPVEEGQTLVTIMVK